MPDTVESDGFESAFRNSNTMAPAKKKASGSIPKKIKKKTPVTDPEAEKAKISNPASKTRKKKSPSADPETSEKAISATEPKETKRNSPGTDPDKTKANNSSTSSNAEKEKSSSPAPKTGKQKSSSPNPETTEKATSSTAPAKTKKVSPNTGPKVIRKNNASTNPKTAEKTSPNIDPKAPQKHSASTNSKITKKKSPSTDSKTSKKAIDSTVSNASKGKQLATQQSSHKKASGKISTVADVTSRDDLLAQGWPVEELDGQACCYFTPAASRLPSPFATLDSEQDRRFRHIIDSHNLEDVGLLFSQCRERAGELQASMLGENAAADDNGKSRRIQSLVITSRAKMAKSDKEESIEPVVHTMPDDTRTLNIEM